VNVKARSLRQSNIKVKGVLTVMCILVCTCSFTMAQADREFIDKENGFMITLVGNWRGVPYTDAVGRQKTEFVYQNRDQGLLKITRDNLRGSALQDIVRREMDDFALCNSCVFAGQEAFAGGSLSGIRVALYYVEGDRRNSRHILFSAGARICVDPALQRAIRLPRDGPRHHRCYGPQFLLGMRAR
jgi:hypothetical protein